MEETNKELSMRPQYGIVEEESKGRVDYAIKEAEDLIYITGDKQHKIPVGGTGTSFYIVLKKIPRQAILPIQSNLSRRPWLMIPKSMLTSIKDKKAKRMIYKEIYPMSLKTICEFKPIELMLFGEKGLGLCECENRYQW
ncbi:hypothetical protein GLOIN_2v1869226 [Rhizophagus irregularis DAOM 181602=DAOM 197198]|nr:hypothetical protein GLOIN_2v1869226 [Rhizophagus irregularis DAOM 181602=DAOM 197198]